METIEKSLVYIQHPDEESGSHISKLSLHQLQNQSLAKGSSVSKLRLTGRLTDVLWVLQADNNNCPPKQQEILTT